MLRTILVTFYQAVSQKTSDKKNIHSDGSRPTCDTMLTACSISPKILLDNITMIRTVLKLLMTKSFKCFLCKPQGKSTNFIDEVQFTINR